MILMSLGIIAVGSEWIRAGGIFLFFLVAAMIVAALWKPIFGRLVAKTTSTLDDMIVSRIRGPVIWALIVAGAYNAFLEISATQKQTVIWSMLGKAFTIVWILLAVVSINRIFNILSRWKIEQAAELEGQAYRDAATRINFFRKLLTGIAFFIGGLCVLSAAGVNTSPLVAGGAIGGIVIGIALQDTLSNVFAGFFLNIDRPVKIGDFVRLENNQEGFIEEVGWRYTKVRLYANNLIIIPNNKFSQSTITNFNLPSEALSIYIPCGVAYGSDLEHVEAVAIRIATQVQESVSGGDTSWQPLVRFKEFGPSAILFTTTLRAVEVDAQYRVQHQFIKELHRAFQEEGIEIPYPIQTIQLKKLDTPSQS